MKKLHLVICLLIVFFKFFSQEIQFEKPDYNKIKNEINDKNSLLNYEKLSERLKNKDTLLTLKEFRHLYFGYAFQSKYNAYWSSPDAEALKPFYNSKELQPTDFEQIIKLTMHSIADNPFDLRNMNFQSYAYHMKGNELEAKKTSLMFRGILEAILSSGDGKVCETGFHVLSVSDEYTLLNMFQLQSVSQGLVGNCDYLSFEKGKYKIDGMYFNIQKMLENQMNLFKK